MEHDSTDGLGDRAGCARIAPLSESAANPSEPAAEASSTATPRPILALAAALALAALVAIPFDLLPWLRGPAPYPPEWQWGFRPEGPAHPLWAAAACATLLVGLLAASFAGPCRRRQRLAAAWLVAAAVALGSAYPILLLARDPTGPLRALVARAVSPSFTSYHTVAASEAARDPLAFLRAHAGLLPELARTAKHAATHPPGPVLFYRAAIGACETWPSLTDALLRASGAPDRTSATNTRAARAGALAGELCLVLLGSLSAWPLARAARDLGLDGLAAARVALLWALAPGPALMTPQLDQALALPVVLTTWLVLRAARASGVRRLVAHAVLAGLSGAVAIFMSYGTGAFLVIGGLTALAAATPAPGDISGRGPVARRAVLVALIATLVAALLAFGLPSLLGHEPLRALRTALAIHHEAYTAPRRYALWLFFDPLDLALFLGLPVAVLALWRAGRSLQRAASRQALAPLERFSLATVTGVALLVASGVTRGEVGRIWIPLMPLLLLGGATAEGAAATVAIGSLQAALTLTMAAFWGV